MLRSLSKLVLNALSLLDDFSMTQSLVMDMKQLVFKLPKFLLWGLLSLSFKEIEFWYDISIKILHLKKKKSKKNPNFQQTDFWIGFGGAESALKWCLASRQTDRYPCDIELAHRNRSLIQELLKSSVGQFG